MKLNSDKCHLLVSGHHYEEMFVNIGKDIIWESKTVELLGITIDKEFDKFDKYINQVCSKANEKLNVLSRMQSFLSLEKRKTILSLLLNHSSNTILWFGCFAAEKTMIKSIGFMKDH